MPNVLRRPKQTPDLRLRHASSYLAKATTRHGMSQNKGEQKADDPHKHQPADGNKDISPLFHEWHMIPPNDPALARRANDYQMPTKAQIRCCQKPDGYTTSS
jgi:hypothetical protein